MTTVESRRNSNHDETSEENVSRFKLEEGDEKKPNPRLSMYKYYGNTSNQEERRKRLLEEQKKKRGESFNAGRLIEELCTLSEDEADMECSYPKTKPRSSETFKGRLMMSEWLVHVPEDLAKLWYMVPCPKGHRSLVVATRGFTRSYTKFGTRTAVFRSSLPGGNHDDGKGCTLLDCIWSPHNNSYYILDVLAWGNQPMMDCETEFRFYWLKTKIEEYPSLLNVTEENKRAFVLLPHYPCEISTIAEVMSNERMFGAEGPSLDGLLFYHSQTHYNPGTTPLVGWLKPSMVTDVLGAPVAGVYLQEEMESDCIAKDKKRHRRRKNVAEGEVPASMETSLEDTDDSCSGIKMEEPEFHDELCDIDG